jgi:hypothetical protein
MPNRIKTVDVVILSMGAGHVKLYRFPMKRPCRAEGLLIRLEDLLCAARLRTEVLVQSSQSAERSGLGRVVRLLEEATTLLDDLELIYSEGAGRRPAAAWALSVALDACASGSRGRPH